MKEIFLILSAAAAGFLASMGLGGGAVLIIFLRSFFGFKQFKAQGINLLFFVPIALFTTILNTIKKRLDFNAALYISSGGILGAAAGVFLSSFIGAKWISKFFGAGIILYGAAEIIKEIKTILARKRKL